MSLAQPIGQKVVELFVPSNMDALLVVRLAVSGVATSRFDVEALEDVKLAAHEACYALIHQTRCFERLRVIFDGSGDAFSILVEGSGKPIPGMADMPVDVELCQSVLETIIDEANIEYDPEGMYRIHMVKR